MSETESKKAGIRRQAAEMSPEEIATLHPKTQALIAWAHGTEALRAFVSKQHQKHQEILKEMGKPPDSVLTIEETAALRQRDQENRDKMKAELVAREPHKSD